MNRLKLAVDFDGTLCHHRYPQIGEELTEGIEFLKGLQKQGAQLFLDTMRSGTELEEAIKWCKDRGLVFDSIGPQISQRRWTTSPKCHADFSIDDRNATVPVLYDDKNSPFLDWKEFIPKFIERLKREGWIKG